MVKLVTFYCNSHHRQQRALNVAHCHFNVRHSYWTGYTLHLSPVLYEIMCVVFNSVLYWCQDAAVGGGEHGDAGQHEQAENTDGEA